MSRIPTMLAAAVKDGVVSDAEWIGLKVAWGRNPAEARRAAPKLVDAYHRNHMHERVRDDFRYRLGQIGYDVPKLSAPISPATAIKKRRSFLQDDPIFLALQRKVPAAIPEVVIGILDSEFKISAPALANKLFENPGETIDGKDSDQNGLIDDVFGWDFKRDTPHLTRGGHGTHVAATAIAGSPDFRFIPVVNARAPAVRYLSKFPVSVVNISQWVNGTDAEQLAQAIEMSPNILFVFSAGNYGRSVDLAGPSSKTYLKKLVADFPNCVVVGNHKTDGARDLKSSWSPSRVHLAALGNDVLAATSGFRNGRKNGTSMAAPQVTRTFAKCKALYPALTPRDFKRLVQLCVDSNASWVGHNATGGILNEERTYRVAALLAHTTNGKSFADAAKSLDFDSPTTQAIKTYWETFTKPQT